MGVLQVGDSLLSKDECRQVLLLRNYTRLDYMRVTRATAPEIPCTTAELNFCVMEVPMSHDRQDGSRYEYRI